MTHHSKLATLRNTGSINVTVDKDIFNLQTYAGARLTSIAAGESITFLCEAVNEAQIHTNIVEGLKQQSLFETVTVFCNIPPQEPPVPTPVTSPEPVVPPSGIPPTNP